MEEMCWLPQGVCSRGQTFTTGVGVCLNVQHMSWCFFPSVHLWVNADIFRLFRNRKQGRVRPKMTFYLRLSWRRGPGGKNRVCILRKCRSEHICSVSGVLLGCGAREAQDEHTVSSHMLWWKTLREPWILLRIRRGQLSHRCSHTMAQSQHWGHMSELGPIFFFVFFFIHSHPCAFSTVGLSVLSIIRV